MPYAVEVDPESALQFTITRDPSPNAEGDHASRCVMTIRHPGLTKLHLAFKVSTFAANSHGFPYSFIVDCNIFDKEEGVLCSSSP